MKKKCFIICTFVVLFLFGSIIFIESCLAQSPIKWSSWEPRVIDLNTTESATLTVVVESDPATVEVTFPSCFSSTTELIPLAHIEANTYEATFTSTQLLHNYQDGDAHSIVGCLRINGDEARISLIVNVKNYTMSDVTVHLLAPDIQATQHVVNLRYDDLLMGSHPPSDVLQRFYDFFDDSFDFIAAIHQVSYVKNRSYRTIRNNIHGIGRPIFDVGTAYGSPSRLLGTITYPIDSFFDLAELALVHEIGHHWIKYLNHPLFQGSMAHWPISDLGYGIIGISGPPSLGYQGLSFPFELVELPTGDYRLDSIEKAREFNDLELYLMGLLPENEVSEHFVFQNQDQPVCHGCILQDPVEWITIEDIIAVDGPRIPSFEDSQKQFNLATLVLSKDRLLTNNEMAFFDHMAARGESKIELPFTSGLDRGITKPFYLATGGRATLSTDCTQDCTGTWGGTAEEDNCGNCLDPADLNFNLDTDNDSILDCNDNCPSDPNNLCFLNLQDVILALQIMLGIETSGDNDMVDVNGDGKIGLEEAIYALQVTSGRRP